MPHEELLAICLAPTLFPAQHGHKSRYLTLVTIQALPACLPFTNPQAGSTAAADYTALVNLTAQQLRAAVPGATVSVDVPWSPFDVDGRNYDWRGLAAAADLLFVMAYDTQSQVSSPLPPAAAGMTATGQLHWAEKAWPPTAIIYGP